MSSGERSNANGMEGFLPVDLRSYLVSIVGRGHVVSDHFERHFIHLFWMECYVCRAPLHKVVLDNELFQDEAEVAVHHQLSIEGISVIVSNNLAGAPPMQCAPPLELVDGDEGDDTQVAIVT